jgi:large subunit ribosomal protein L15
VKGQLARHNEMPDHFEGGQNPIQRRVPKRGFVSIHRLEIHGVNVGRLEGAFKAGEEVTVESLHQKGLVPKRAKLIKLLGEGDLNTALKVSLHGASESARQKVEAAGGSVQVLAKPEAPAEA